MPQGPPLYARSQCFDTSPSRPIWHAALKRSGPISPRSNGLVNVLFGLFGRLLALVHAARAEALLPLEPYGSGKDLSLAADHYLHRAFDAEEAVLLCFCRHWSSPARRSNISAFSRSTESSDIVTLLVVAAEGSHDVRDRFQVGL